MIRPILASVVLGFTIPVLAQSGSKQDLASTTFVLLVEGRVMDNDDKPLGNSTVRVEQDGKLLAEWVTDPKGRFSVDLDIGGLYAVDVQRIGFVHKRFIVDSRADDPSKIITVPFEAHISLITEKALEGADLEQLDFPFALVSYDKKERAFMADPTYIDEMKNLESALMLSSAISRKKKTH